MYIYSITVTVNVNFNGKAELPRERNPVHIGEEIAVGHLEMQCLVSLKVTDDIYPKRSQLAVVSIPALGYF